MPHTPGPWAPDSWGDDEYDVYTAGTDKLICSLAQSYDEETGQGLNANIEADARLIAAAPELLNALRQAKDELIVLYEKAYPNDETDNETTQIIDRAIAVIAQAEGS
jgi:hypothetical protein